MREFIQRLGKLLLATVQTQEKRGVLPWYPFVILPVYACTIHLLFLFPFVFMPDAPHMSHEFSVALNLVLVTAEVAVVTWIICLILYFVPGIGKRPVFCLLPLMAFGCHAACVAAIYVNAFIPQE